MVKQAQHLTERTGELERGRIYTADSDTDAYGSLLAAVDLGAEFLGEHFLEDGVRSIAVRIPLEGGARKNFGAQGAGRIRIGEAFYGKALLDYRPDWRPMWWREVIQNSVDAGRKKNGMHNYTKIDLKVEAQPDGSRLVSCTDNGGGMDWDTFKNKFLALGESGKPAGGRYDYRKEMARTRAATEETEEGDAGGFGEAKRLLILPWLDVEVHCRDWITRATPNKEEEFDPKPAPFFLDGMRLTVRMPASNYCDEEHALRVITRSFLPTVRFTVNGKGYKADLPLGEKEIEPFAEECSGKALLYHSPRSRKFRADNTADSIDGYKPKKTGEMIVRKRGIWMFSLPVESKVPGYLVLRLVAPSVDVLTASRMQIGDYELSDAVSAQLRELARDHHKALKSKKNHVWRPYKGSLGMVRAEVREENERLAAIMKQQVGAADKIAERESVAAVESFIERVNEVSERAEERAKEEGETRDKPVGAVEGPQVGDDSYGGKDEEDDDEGGDEQGPPKLTHDPSLAKVYAEAAAKAGADGMDALSAVIQNIHDSTILSEIDDFYRDKESGKILTGKQYRLKHGLEEDEDPPQRLLWRPAKRFDPAHLTPQLRKLLKYWTECLSVILLALGEKRPFGVGWIFDFRKDSDGNAEGALAAHAQRDGKHWLLLNPFRAGDIQAEALYSLRNDHDLKLIHSCAMHEATHFHNYAPDHDVDFAIALTKNIAIANLSLSDLRAIRDAAVKRPKGWKPKPKPVKKVVRRLKPEIEASIVKIRKDLKGDYGVVLPVNSRFTGSGSDDAWMVTKRYKGWAEGGSRYGPAIKRRAGWGSEFLVVFESDDKLTEKEYPAFAEAKLRELLVETYGPAIEAAEVDEDLKSTFEQWESEIAKAQRLDDVNVLNFTTGAGKTVEISLSSISKWVDWEAQVYIGGLFVAEYKMAKVDTSKEGWQKRLGKAIIKAVAPILAERWRT